MFKQRPSFQEVVNELLATGLTQTDIAKKTGVDQPTLSKLKEGAVRTKLFYDRGDALMQYYDQIKTTQKRKAQAAKRKARLSDKAARND